MSSGTIRIILVLMLLTIGALFVTQAYWFKKSFSLQETQLDDKMNIALRNVADNLLFLVGDSTTRIPPIVKLSSNEYLVETNCFFTLKVVDEFIRSEFKLRKIDVDFDYMIINNSTDEVTLGNTILGSTLSGLQDTTEVACRTREELIDTFNFKVRINNKTSYLLESMGIWMYSSLSLLLILAVFTFITISIIKSKRLSLLKKDFVNNMTHELKTPIANIAVASDAIRSKNVPMDDVKLEKYANIIYNENDRLHNLVDRVLQISAIEKNDETLSFETIDVHEIIQKIALSFDPLIQKRKGSIKAELEAKRFKLQADKLHVSNVINNLIENAVKYSKENPEITIKTLDTKGGIHIEISDKGIGMNKENQERIFEKFFRAETGNLHNTKGYGLGLCYVKLIVEKHNGEISFKSAEGVGSTFTIFLPI